MPVFVSSLKDDSCEAIVRGLFAALRPTSCLMPPALPLRPGGQSTSTVLDEAGAVVLQVVLAGHSAEAWQASAQGLDPRDLAMNVALPEVDGRILSRAVAFKHAGEFDPRIEATIVRHRGRAGPRRLRRASGG